MLLWCELIQALSMVPVFVVHFWHNHYTMAQSFVGMTHSVFSFLSHFIWWWHQDDWPLWAVEFHIADKCLIIAMVWGFHYHFEPSLAKIMAIPCLINTTHIVIYQHQYIHLKYAYFDIVLLVYCLMTSLDYIKKKPENILRNMFLLTLCAIGYSMDVPGLMHLCLTPVFWLWYSLIQHSKKEKFSIQ